MIVAPIVALAGGLGSLPNIDESFAALPALSHNGYRPAPRSTARRLMHDRREPVHDARVYRFVTG